MGRKKTNFFLSALLVLLFGMALNTCSYASITEEYVLYSLENGNFDGVYTGYVSIDGYKQLKNRINISELTQLLNNDIEQLGISNPHDYNVSCFFQSMDSPVYYNIFFILHNNSRNTYDNLGYLEINLKGYRSAYVKSHNSEPIYRLDYYYNNNYTFNSKKITTITSETVISNFNSRKVYTIENLQDLSIFNQNIFTTTNLSEYFINYPKDSTNIYSSYLKMNNSWFEMVNDNPTESGEGGGSGTTGTITNPSGDITGKVDLSGIEQGIVDINANLNGISGEIGKINENLTTVPNISDKTITSEDITNALNFDFAEDPYSNFWLELTTGLSGALTNNVRSIDVQFRNKTYKIELDEFAIQIPEFLKSFLSILSTVFIFWKMIKYWKIIIDNITSGNMDEVLEMNEEERNY